MKNRYYPADNKCTYCGLLSLWRAFCGRVCIGRYASKIRLQNRDKLNEEAQSLKPRPRRDEMSYEEHYAKSMGVSVKEARDKLRRRRTLDYSW